jgi:hypothetical protein
MPATGHPSGADAHSLPVPACMTATLTAGSDIGSRDNDEPGYRGDKHEVQ